MAFLTDNLNAILVVAALGLVLAGLQRGSSRAQIDSTERASGRTVVTQTADWIERDVLNAGFDVEPDDDAVLAYAWSPTAGSFTFVTMSDTSSTATADTVRYVYQTTSTGRRLDRFRVQGGVETPSATTGQTLDSLSITLLDAAGSPVGTDLARTAQVRVLLRARSVLDDGEARFLWDRLLLPPNLRRLAS